MIDQLQAELPSNRRHRKRRQQAPPLRLDVHRLLDRSVTGWGPPDLESSIASIHDFGTETLTHYRPLHLHGLDWVIVVKDDGVSSLASRLVGEHPPDDPTAVIGSPNARLVIEDAVRTAATFLYYHEVIHHSLGRPPSTPSSPTAPAATAPTGSNHHRCRAVELANQRDEIRPPAGAREGLRRRVRDLPVLSAELDLRVSYSAVPTRHNQPRRPAEVGDFDE